MSKQVRTAVFPAGGLGTRFLPATKVIPKEMLALVDKPIIQYGVEEAIASGIEHIIFITGRGKGAMEDHFDISYELDATLESKGKKELLEISRKISSLARVSYVRQKEPLGLGHAVLCAKELVGDEPFAVLLPDDVIDAKVPCIKQMIDVYNERQGSVLATMTIEGPGISAYGVLAGSQDPTNDRIYNCTGMVEKPKFEDAPSKQAIIGRYILTPRVFETSRKDRARRRWGNSTDGRHPRTLAAREGLRLHVRRQALRRGRQVRHAAGHSRIRAQSTGPRTQVPRISEDSCPLNCAIKRSRDQSPGFFMPST